jgi:hypothetical protein
MKKLPLPPITTTYQYARFHVQRAGYRPNLSPDAKTLLEQLRDQGYAILENYFNLEQCNVIRAEILSVFERFPNYVHHRSDRRFFGIENLIPLAMNLAQNPLFQELASAVNFTPSRTAFTMANILSASRHGSSGEGWHRDAFFSQFKVMVYVTDVGLENGPFEMLAGSHHLWQIIKDAHCAHLGAQQRRLSDREVARLVEAEPNRVKTFTAAAGTAILFNSSTIHRGRPIVAGERMALTSYMYEDHQIGDWMTKHFAPLYPHPVDHS